MYEDIVNPIFANEPVLLPASRININPETGFLLRHVYGHTEGFNFHTHEFYEIFLTISGDTLHCVNHELRILEPGCLVFVRPQDMHCYIYKQKKYEFINLAISSEILEAMLAYLGNATDISHLLNSKFPPVVRLTPREMKSFLKRADLFYTINTDDIVTQRLNIRSFLMDVFIKYFIGRKGEDRHDKPLWLEEVCERMNQPENFIIGIKRMVELSGKTQEHLARTLKKYYGVSLSQFVNELRLNYAVNLLVNTNLKITDICYEAGFGNISSFYSLFSAAYHMSPKKFRNTHTI